MNKERPQKSWRKCKLQVHKQNYTKAKNHKNRLIIKENENHIRNLFRVNKGNPKVVYEIVKNLTKHSKPSDNVPSPEDPQELTEDLATYFDQWTRDIRAILVDQTPAHSEDAHVKSATDNQMDSFDLSIEKEVLKIIKTLPNKTCSLHSIPSLCVIKCAHELSLAIVSAANCSLVTGEMPRVLKKTVVRPLLKKTGLHKSKLSSNQ
ncbi:reverse transcriptase-like protein [Elysia marginata]|uniref:Reverse transcriptase-like protein n=1 Tax=Elysia marginata TaxID=1093978 RepID=A0AAV4EFA4_9GAST|nr:reverse transcriptase-like protein [Elysia marginata]